MLLLTNRAGPLLGLLCFLHFLYLLNFLPPPRYTSADAAEAAMNSEAARPAPIMKLGELVHRYNALVKKHGAPVSLAAFELSQEETERLFSGYEEDYHIGRFFHFEETGGTRYSVNGFPATHVSIDAEIETIL